MLHKDHWDVSDRKGKKVIEISLTAGRFGQMDQKITAKGMVSLVRKRCVSPYDLSAIETKMAFYSFKNQSVLEGSSAVIRLASPSDTVRFCDLSYGGEKSTYYEQEHQFVNQLKVLLGDIETECVVRPYDSLGDRACWDVDCSNFPALAATLSESGIKPDFEGGLLIDTTDTIIDDFIRVDLRYKGFFQFLFPREMIVITPTDHMDAFTSCDSTDTLANILSRLQDEGLVLCNIVEKNCS